MIPNLAIFRQYFLGNYQFSSCLSTIEGTCLPQPEAALFPFELTGAAYRLVYLQNVAANFCVAVLTTP